MPKLTKQLKPGIKVEVIAGKYKGESGEITKIDRNKSRVYLDGINEKLDYSRNMLEDQDFGPKLKNLGVNISNVKIAEKDTKSKKTKKKSKSKKSNKKDK